MVCGMCEAPHELFLFYQSSEIHMNYIQFICVSLTGSTARVLYTYDIYMNTQDVCRLRDFN